MKTFTLFPRINSLNAGYLNWVYDLRKIVRNDFNLSNIIFKSKFSTTNTICASSKKSVSKRKLRQKPTEKSVKFDNGRGDAKVQSTGLKLKYFRRRIQQSYTIIEGIAARSRRFVAGIKVNSNLNVALLKQGLGRYLSKVYKIGFQEIRSLCPELGVKPGAARGDLIRILSSFLLRETLLLCEYYQNNIVTETDHIRYGFHVSRKLPALFVRFLSVIALRDRYVPIPGTTNYAFIEKGDVIIEHDAKVNKPDTALQFFERIERLCYVCELIDPSLNRDFNLWETFPGLDCLFCCGVTKTADEIVLQHSDQIPTESEACAAYMLGLSYEITGVSSNNLGDESYGIPLDFEPHLAFKFWEDLLSIGPITVISKLESFGGNFDVITKFKNVPESVSPESSGTGSEPHIVDRTNATSAAESRVLFDQHKPVDAHIPDEPVVETRPFLPQPKAGTGRPAPKTGPG